MRGIRTYRLVILGVFVCVALFWGSVTSMLATEQPVTAPDKNKVSEDLRLEGIKKKIGDLKERIRLAKQAENGQIAEQMGVKLADLQERTASLRSMESAYERLLTALNKKEALKGEQAALREKLKAQLQIGVAQKPPYALSFYDRILDELEAAEQQKESAELAARLGLRGLEGATMRLENAQKELRIVKDRLDAINEKEKTREQKSDLQKAELEKELAEALVSFEKVNHENLLIQVKLADLRSDISRRNIVWVREHLYFDKTDLDKQLETIEHRRKELKNRIQKLIQEKKQAEEALFTSQKRSASTTDKNLDTVAAAALKEREAWIKTYQAVLEQTEDMLGFLGHQEQAWILRYGLLKEEIGNEKSAIQRREIENHIESLNRMLGVQQSFQTNLQSQITAVENRISEEGVEPQIKSHLKSEMKAMQTLAERRFEYISALLATQQIDRLVLDEIDLKLKQISLKQRLANIKNQFQRVWNFELWVIDEHAVTVRKIFSALLILVIGIFIVRYGIRVIKKRLLPRTSLEAGAAAAIETMLYYFALLVIVLFALRMVNIPLTAFTFLGGAIAIGVGFGAQNLINNFISGFIIMAERPIKINDMIEMEGNFAIVEQIGARCTRIRTGANIHILVPNSSFLEKNITNWTLSDKKVRAHVTVGVIYGSPVREVERLMIEAAREHEKVLNYPEPFVLFNDFGDNALIFDVYFWLSMTRIMERRMIESDIRFHVDGLFREAGIVIAFPQRDVHLDAKIPVQLQIMDSGKEGLKK